jgi:NAD(P)H-hydrate repair Nnr-like enzyme with NAD(P)H-hydrate dehydratase domain
MAGQSVARGCWIDRRLGRSAIAEIASHAPELMTEPLRETESGSIALNANPLTLARGRAWSPSDRAWDAHRADGTCVEVFEGPMVMDADALKVEAYRAQPVLAASARWPA